ncbi:MAG: hypothetical protein A3B38_00680 [Candidatus Levybacteria bacterium RIFCSPLOWO2_01_FULL_36_13]|nr:MAG: hypothetical protein A2684_01920 [Candidatus Levybacteria bacterium RIFCSPHIGHO2_01_FULL_36_15b]OGH35403.1 MAG: hypothetical protein A3B38_00680 [Candidatus Levybacteria bacterium RIFCSPLOWO2_01_FULL_36_13]
MDKNSTFGQLFEQGKSAIDDSASNVIDATKQQITGSQPAQSQPNLQNNELQAQLSDDSREIINDFYAPSQNTNTPQDLEDKEEKLAKVRKELQGFKSSLHQTTYYEPLFAYEKKKKEASQQQEEYQEEEKKMEELQQAEKKKQDLDTFRKQRGVEIRASAG